MKALRKRAYANAMGVRYTRFPYKGAQGGYSHLIMDKDPKDRRLNNEDVALIIPTPNRKIVDSAFILAVNGVLSGPMMELFEHYMLLRRLVGVPSGSDYPNSEPVETELGILQASTANLMIESFEIGNWLQTSLYIKETSPYTDYANPEGPDPFEGYLREN